MNRGQQMNLPAIYLAGYTVECALKALIVERTPVGQRRDLTFHGKRGHDFEDLRALLKQRQCVVSREIAEPLRRVQTWSVDLRYEVGLVPTADAEKFLAAAKAVLDWVVRSAG